MSLNVIIFKHIAMVTTTVTQSNYSENGRFLLGTS